MPVSIFKLTFTTGLHIGMDSSGKSLDNGRLGIHSDTLFSALCLEALKAGCMNEFYKAADANGLVLSDALPFDGNTYYFPRPVLYNETWINAANPSVRKAIKAFSYIPSTEYKAYFDYLSGKGEAPKWAMGNFGVLDSQMRVAIERDGASTPYNLAYWRFREGCGLYLLVQWQEEADLKMISALLHALGLSGIGGKSSSGLGKFDVEKKAVPEDMAAVLMNETADYQILLGVGLPEDNLLEEALNDGWYSLIRRGGFIRSDTYSVQPVKKQAIYMLAPGSCLRRRFEGSIKDVAPDKGEKAHPVWRNGKTLFAGVSL